MKRFILLFAVCIFFNACKDNPVKNDAVYTPPKLIITNTKSKLYPNDLIPLSAGNFWIYKRYYAEQGDSGAYWKFSGLDTVYIESDSSSLWSYSSSDAYFSFDTTKRANYNIVKQLNAYKATLCAQSFYGSYYDTNFDLQVDPIITSYGQYFAKADSNWILLGKYNKGMRLFVAPTSFCNNTNRNYPEAVQFTHYHTVETDLQKFENCRVFTAGEAWAVSIVPGIGPVAYFWGSDKITGISKLCAYGVK